MSDTNGAPAAPPVAEGGEPMSKSALKRLQKASTGGRALVR
jgi:hypothetical protein